MSIPVEMVRPAGIVGHHSEDKDTPRLEFLSILDWHVNHNRWRTIGYHWVLEDFAGHVLAVQGREPFMLGAHCRGHNNMIGICLVGKFNLKPPSEALLEKTARLVKALLLQYNYLTPKDVYDHRDLNDTTCPGKYFSMKRDVLPRL